MAIYAWRAYSIIYTGFRVIRLIPRGDRVSGDGDQGVGERPPEIYAHPVGLAFRMRLPRPLGGGFRHADAQPAQYGDDSAMFIRIGLQRLELSVAQRAFPDPRPASGCSSRSPGPWGGPKPRYGRELGYTQFRVLDLAIVTAPWMCPGLGRGLSDDDIQPMISGERQIPKPFLALGLTQRRTLMVISGAVHSDAAGFQSRG